MPASRNLTEVVHVTLRNDSRNGCYAKPLRCYPKPLREGCSRNDSRNGVTQNRYAVTRNRYAKSKIAKVRQK